MKKRNKIYIFFIFICYLNFCYAEEYTLFEDTYSITFYNNLSVEYRKNDILNVTKVIPFGEYSSIYFGKIGEDEFIAINKFTNDSSQILLPNNFLAAVFEEGSYLYPKYVVDTVFKQNRDYLSNFESENMKTMTIDDGSWGITYWYEREIKSQLISNEVLSLGSFFGLSTFFVKNIKKINKNEFEIFTIANIRILPGDLTKNYLFADIKNEEEVKFRLKKDGDYLEVFVDNEESPRETYCYVNNDFRIAINKLVKNNSCENQNLTWPRHADGTCDYEDVSSIKTVSTPSTNVTPNKTMTVFENLKLRSAEATTSDVLTVMQAGTKVKILELGKADNIDGINSNWVKVEVQSGAKDRDGRTIRAGTVGWCYGGYLAETTEANNFESTDTKEISNVKIEEAPKQEINIGIVCAIIGAVLLLLLVILIFAVRKKKDNP